MAVIEYDEYKQKLQALEPTLGELEKALGIPKDRQELKDLQDSLDARVASKSASLKLELDTAKSDLEMAQQKVGVGG